jgi:hypothetical protein
LQQKPFVSSPSCKFQLITYPTPQSFKASSK